MNLFIKFLLAAVSICVYSQKNSQLDSLNEFEGVRIYNLYSDIIYGGGVIYNESLNEYPTQLHTGFLKLGFDENLNQVSKKIIKHARFNKGISINSEAGLFLSTKYYGKLTSPSQMIISMHFPTDYYKESNNYSLGFWVNVKKLNGNGLAFSKINGAFSFFSHQDLKTLGARAYQQNNKVQNYIFEITRVDGDYSYLRYNPDNTYIIRFFISKESGEKVTELEILNPVFLDGDNHKINPYFEYKSKSESLNSDKIGKRAVVIGDSQHQDRELHKVIARHTGLNIISMARGGHSIKYKSRNKNQANMFWFYEKELREKILKIEDVDYYILPLSTNDTKGGGELSNEAINAVIENYPYYTDNQKLSQEKLKIFENLSENEKEKIFGYKQTFAAYIMQLKEVNPNARFLLSSIPISPSHMTGKKDNQGHGIWADGWNAKKAKEERMPIYTSMRRDSRELADWFGANWADLQNKVNLNFENAPEYTTDGIHWFPEIKKRIGKVFSDELQDM